MPSTTAAPLAAPPTLVAPTGARPSRPARDVVPTGAHGADIAALAATPDGEAVVSVDRVGGIRLWPTLDGTREPAVLRGGAARGLTLARDGDGFVVGMLDDAGGVRVVRTDARGATRASTAIDHPVRALQIESTSDGVVILWADQTVALVSARGALRATLAADAGTQIAALVARSGRVLAVVREDKQLRGHWLITDANSLRWGAATGALPRRLEHLALSPDGTRIAGSLPDSVHPVLIDLATGARAKAPLCVSKGWPADDGLDLSAREILNARVAPFPVGFLDDRMIACNVNGALVWWTTAGVPEPTTVGGLSLGTQPLAMSSRALIVGRNTYLGLTTPLESRYLGYGMHDVGALRTGPGGTVVAGEQRTLYVDAGLGERAPLDLGRFHTVWQDLVPLDDRYIVVLAQRRLTRDRTAGEIAVYDVATRTIRQLLPFAVGEGRLSYEPSTHLLAASAPDGGALLTYDPASHTFGAPARTPRGFVAGRLFAVDPRSTDGVAALQIEDLGDAVEVGEIMLADVRPGAAVAPRSRYRVPGSLRAVDRAGHVYAHAEADGADVAVYTRGVRGARLHGMADLELRPSASGAYVAGFATPRLALARADGTRLWETAHWSAGDLGWASDDALVVQLASAIAHVDLETGALVDRRCGLAFGLSESPLDDGGSAASVCDALDEPSAQARRYVSPAPSAPPASTSHAELTR